MVRIFGDCSLHFRNKGQYFTLRNTENLYYGYPRSKNASTLNVYCGFILYPNGKKDYFDRISVEKSNVISIGVGKVSIKEKQKIADYCKESDIYFEDITLNMLFNEYREG